MAEEVSTNVEVLAAPLDEATPVDDAIIEDAIFEDSTLEDPAFEVVTGISEERRILVLSIAD